ncbi:hypothetical protein [Glycomyces harbinensis]|uniref:Uncharacterized protein n=1 Tax=Glycomyces harbinensis TaxID=58114 RepID=A0A1G6QVT6_9ACTN|nr:hypothetical protein [Glycomyces harbinensis]SDC96408.1 hypothetical protein SAMN05216270_101143 [Glycomyces harbinensis]
MGEQQPHDEWWTSGPVFSTTDQGSKITTIAPGAPLGTLTPKLAAGAALTCATWAGLAFAVIPRTMGSGNVVPWVDEAAHSWWWIALSVVGIIGLVSAAPSFYGTLVRRFGQQTFGFGCSVAIAAAGFLAAGLVHLRMIAVYRASTPSAAGPDDTIVLIVTAVACAILATGLVWLPFAFFRARRRQRRIIGLRETGTRFAGEVDSLEFKNQWISGRPQFDATIRYALDAETRTIRAAMATVSDRVPLPGFPVRVMVGDGAALVEPDLDRPAAFDPDTDQYTQPSGGGG